MLRRGGIGTGLGERMAIYTRRARVRAVRRGAFPGRASASRCLPKLIREWLTNEPERRFTVATDGDRTCGGDGSRHSESEGDLFTAGFPVDGEEIPRPLRALADRLGRGRGVAAPAVGMQGEEDPRQIGECEDVAAVRPEVARFAAWLRPIYQLLDAAAIDTVDAGIWETLGIDGSRVHDTGSLKFDPGSGARLGNSLNFRKCSMPSERAGLSSSPRARMPGRRTRRHRHRHSPSKSHGLASARAETRGASVGSQDGLGEGGIRSGVPLGIIAPTSIGNRVS